MSALVLLITVGGLVAGGFLVAFVWAVRAGQFDDATTPPLRMLFDPVSPPPDRASPSSHPVRSTLPGVHERPDSSSSSLSHKTGT